LKWQLKKYALTNTAKTASTTRSPKIRTLAGIAWIKDGMKTATSRFDLKIRMVSEIE